MKRVYVGCFARARSVGTKIPRRLPVVLIISTEAVVALTHHYSRRLDGLELWRMLSYHCCALDRCLRLYRRMISRKLFLRHGVFVRLISF